uniref:Retrovirus-related Pol polyprotein from transposon TNT 1-94-like beta-barrel domain-containing protein n=1 Tax=Photinus pyralis TaxID=7054 RepID=A0A1Y1MAC2_PHOPY
MEESRVVTKRNIKPFNGEHYAIWKFRIKSLIAEEDALKVIEGDPPEVLPPRWKQLERRAKGYIIEYLSDSMLGLVTEGITAKQILEKLDSLYERKSLATQLSVQKKLLSFKYNEEKRLMDHFREFDEMMVELHSAGGKLEEMSKVAHLLLTLPPCYDPLVTAIQTLSEENLNLSLVKTKLLDYETKLQLNKCETGTKVLQAANKSRHRNFKSKPHFLQKPQSTFTSRKGYHFKNKNMNYRSKPSNCEHCGRRNHIKKECHYYRRMISQQKDHTAQTTQILRSKSPPFAFMLRSKSFETSAATNGTITFILDSGATDHIVNQLHYFTHSEELSTPVEISVAKEDSSIKATHRGSIAITTNMGETGILKDVLFSAEVPYNLLYIPTFLTKVIRANNNNF